jgi:hypothetical protein
MNEQELRTEQGDQIRLRETHTRRLRALELRKAQQGLSNVATTLSVSG